jgi:hypothetical protein
MWTTDSARDEMLDTYFHQDDEVTRGMVNDHLDRVEADAIKEATNRLILAFRRWHLDRHHYAPTEHDFRLILDMASGGLPAMTDTPRKDGPRTEAGLPCGFRFGAGDYRCLVPESHDIHHGKWRGIEPDHDYEPFERRHGERRAEAAAGPRPAASTTPQARDDGLREALAELLLATAQVHTDNDPEDIPTTRREFAAPTRLSSSIDDDSTPAPREETP